MPRPAFFAFRLLIVVAAAAVIVLSWMMVSEATDGLVIRRWVRNGVPLRYVGPQSGGLHPGVIIAHGFAGSQELMLAYSYVLANAGYGTVSLDFSGHGRHAAPLDFAGDSLDRDLETALSALNQIPEIDPARVALLGHSMGSGVVMRAGVADPERVWAVVAISPTDAAVTESAPPNLYLQAGALEPGFAAGAADLLARAGGTNEDLAAGRGRRFDQIPWVEHIGILFSDASHQGVRSWLDGVFGLRPEAVTYVDRRILWYLLHLLAWLAAIPAAAPLWQGQIPEPPPTDVQPWSRLLLLLAPLGATLLLFLINLSTPVRALGGILVGGALALWFFMVGFAWLLGGFRPLAFTWADLWAGVLLFALLTLAFGALAQLVWAPWWLTLTRLARLPFLILAIMPWQLAAAKAQAGADWRGRALWWLGQTLALGGGLLLTVLLIPDLRFILLILPLLPILLAIMAIAGGAFGKRPWAVALGNAAFFGWVLLVFFPLTN